MEGSGRVAVFGHLGLRKRGGVPTSHILGSAASLMQHEALHNFFKSLLNIKDRAASPGAPAGRPLETMPKTSGGAGASGASAIEISQTVPDAGSETEDAQ